MLESIVPNDGRLCTPHCDDPFAGGAGGRGRRASPSGGCGRGRADDVRVGRAPDDDDDEANEGERCAGTKNCDSSSGDESGPRRSRSIDSYSASNPRDELLGVGDV